MIQARVLSLFFRKVWIFSSRKNVFPQKNKLSVKKGDMFKYTRQNDDISYRYWTRSPGYPLECQPRSLRHRSRHNTTTWSTHQRITAYFRQFLLLC